MRPQTISIIGGRGKMGSLFADAFRQIDYKVLVSDEGHTNSLQLAEQGDVVIVSVPLEYTEQVIEEIGPYVKEEALLTDFTSVKMKPAAAMLRYSKADVIGGHPLFGPKIESFHGLDMILCPARGKEHLSWYTNTMESMGLKVTVTTAEEHDKTMAVVQCLTHFSNMAFAYALTKMKAKGLPKVTTLAQQLRIYAAQRMLSQDPSLYSGMFSENIFAEDAVHAYADAVAKVSALVQDDEKKGLEELLRSLQPDFEDHPVLRKKKVKIIDE